MRYTDIIFDLDGTVIDSGKGIMHCADYALQQMEIHDYAYDDLRVFVGPPLTNTFARFGVPNEFVDQAVEHYRNLYHKTGMYEVHPYDGIEEVLKHLKNHGYRLYIGTSKPESLAKQILKNLSLDMYFDTIAGATMDHSRNTKTAVLSYLLQQSKMNHPVMVGDTIYDVIGARDVGIDCIGVAWGYGDMDEMTTENAKVIVHSPRELQMYIQKENSL